MIPATPAHSGVNEDAGNLSDNAMSWTRVGGECNYNYKVPSGRQIIVEYLGPKATTGKIADRAAPGIVAEGVDIFAASPDALPFPPSHRQPDGEAGGYFYCAHASGDARPAPGGCWARYGREKGYVHGAGAAAEAVAFRSRFAFHVPRKGCDGGAAWAPTPWLMKEYRLHKDAAVFRSKLPAHPNANMEFVVRKVFTKPAVPPPPARSSDDERAVSRSRDRRADEEAGYPGEEQARKREGWV